MLDLVGKQIKVIVNYHMDSPVVVDTYPLIASDLTEGELDEKQVSVDYNGYSYCVKLHDVNPKLEVRRLDFNNAPDSLAYTIDLPKI